MSRALPRREGTIDRGLEHVERTLDAMLAGGIYDQLGGGFARYSVDSAWQVPHFEKMLYDNGLLARAYLHGYQVLGHARYRRVCEETLDWLLREMRGPGGRLLLRLRRRLRGRGGQVLRLDAGRDPRRAGRGRGGPGRPADAPTPTRSSPTTASPRRATSRARTSSTSPTAPPRRPRPGSTPPAPPCSPPAPSGSRRASTTSASAPGTRWRSRRSPRPARCWDATTTSTRRRPAPSSSSGTCATPRRPPPAHLQGRPRPPERLPRGPRLHWSKRCSSSTNRPSTRAGSRRRGSSPKR